MAAFKHFHIGSEKLAQGEAEITLLIPREAVDDKLGEFAEELKKMKFILNTFSGVSTGHQEDLKIRTVSSSGLMVFLSATPRFGAMVAKVVDFLVSQYKKILEIKKLQREIERLELPGEISSKTKEHANTLMQEAIDKFSVQIVSEYTGADDGRKNELTTAVRISLDMVANRIDRGFNFEVRIEPPKVLDKTAPADQEVNKAVQAIQAAAANMQYMKLEGPPILQLPEEGESAESQNKAEGEGRHKKKSSSKKEGSH